MLWLKAGGHVCTIRLKMRATNMKLHMSLSDHVWRMVHILALKPKFCATTLIAAFVCHMYRVIVGSLVLLMIMAGSDLHRPAAFLPRWPAYANAVDVEACRWNGVLVLPQASLTSLERSKSCQGLR